MGYVQIIRPDGTQIYLGLDNQDPAEIVYICDGCNEPKPDSMGEIHRDGEAIAQMWLCNKCHTQNHA